VTSTMAPLAAPCAGSRTTLGSDPVGSDLTLEAGPGGGEGVPGNLLIDVDGLRMLPQIIEAREPPRAMALKRTLPRMLSDMSSEMFTARETQHTGRKVGAEKSLPFLLFGRGR
jgi:hypothetical protein